MRRETTYQAKSKYSSHSPDMIFLKLTELHYTFAKTAHKAQMHNFLKFEKGYRVHLGVQFALNTSNNELL